MIRKQVLDVYDVIAMKKCDDRGHEWAKAIKDVQAGEYCICRAKISINPTGDFFSYVDGPKEKSYSQGQVNWLLKRAYKKGWQAGILADGADWFVPSAESDWKSSKVREWCVSKSNSSLV